MAMTAGGDDVVMEQAGPGAAITLGGRQFRTPFQDLVEPLQPETLAALRDEIAAARRVLVPIVVTQDLEIIDGYHRATIAAELGLESDQVPIEIVHVSSREEAENLAISLNLKRRQLDQAGLKRQAERLRAAGWSFRRVAEALGVDAETVRRWFSGAAFAAPESPTAEVIGRDGKAYPAERTPESEREERRRRARELRAQGKPLEAIASELKVSLGTVANDLKAGLAVLVPGARQASRVAEALREIEEPPERATVTPRELYREQRRQEVERQHQASLAAAAGSLHPAILVGDFRSPEVAAELEALGVVPGSVDLIITDPPYEVASADLWQALARFAATWLQDGGLLLAFSGQITFPEAWEALAAELDYVWLAAVEHRHGQRDIWKFRIWNGWKPVLVFSRGEPLIEQWWPDLPRGARPRKEDHPWAQTEQEAAAWIERLAAPGAVVLDPMAGSGAFVSAAIHLGRRGIGIERSPECAALAVRKLGLESSAARH